MKKLIIIATALATNCIVNSQTLKWSKEIGSSKEEYSLNHVLDKAGNVYISGKTDGDFEGVSRGANDGFLVKLDAEGRILWKRQFGSEGDEDILWSAIDNSGSVYITGSTTGNLAGKNHGLQDIFITRYDLSGKQMWTKQLGSDSIDIARSICTDDKGYVYVAGATYGRLGEKSTGKSDCFIIKLDQKGNIISTIQFGTPEDDNCFSIVPGKNTLLVCGTTWGSLKGSSYGMIDGFTGRFSKDLSPKGFDQFGSEGFDIALVIHADKYDNIVVGGSTSGNYAGQQAGDGDCFLLKMNPAGEIIWKKQFGTEHHDGVRGIDLDPGTGNIYVSGIFNLPPEKAFVRIVKADDGSLLWEKLFENASGKDINADSRGNFTHLGLTGAELFRKLTGGHDFYIVKFTR